MASFLLTSTGEEETSHIAADLAMALQAGDLILLSGDLGAGKTVFARAIIRQLANDPELDVPSPTYTLCQNYETDLPVSHFDLYRISGMDELDELGWQETLETGCAIVEWPERCFDQAPTGAVRIELTEVGDNNRQLKFDGSAELIGRIHRSFLIREFLSDSPMQIATRSAFSADASARAYELISDGNKTHLLMNAPAMPDGPPVKDGKPYSKIAHLAEDVSAFVAIDKVLRDHGFCAPEILSADLDEGLLLIEHLGSQGILDDKRKPIEERYMASMEFLAAFHQCQIMPEIEITSDQTYRVPHYDPEAILAEVSLLVDWYAPSASKTIPNAQQTSEFHQIWGNYAETAQTFEKALVLRDYHSPNIIWRGNETGTNRIGVIDFQDAVIGPTSYDVASLAQDARVDVNKELETKLLNHYIDLRTKADSSFDEVEFRCSYAIMAAQRATKILGIFVRLNERDGKPEYLKHLPRIRDYLERSLEHEALSDYRDWFSTVIKL